MADHQQIVQNVRGLVAGADQTRTPELEELAAQYAGLCREANARLARCIDYLRRGLRSEAVHLADCEPNVLHLAALLDFPELPQWEQLCASYGLARPPRLRIEAAQELNEAYAIEEPLGPLLGRHRRLALCGAPVVERLDVIRQLAAADPASPCWDEDSRTYEQARIAELNSEARAAIRGKDLPALERMVVEVRDQRWRLTIPDDLKSSIESAATAVRHERANAELQLLVPQVREACAAMSHDDARRVLKQWEAVVTKSGVRVPPDLLAEIRPLIHLVEIENDRRDRQARGREAVARLKTALLNDAPVSELSRLHQFATELEEGVPDDVEREFQTRRASEERHQRREARYQFVLMLVLVSAVGAALVALGVVGIMTSIRH